MVLYLIFALVLVALIALVVVWFVQKKKKARAEAAAAGAVDEGGGAGTEEVDALVKEAERRLGESKQGSLGSLPVFFLAGDTGSTKTSILVNAGVEAEPLAGLIRRDNNIVPTRTANIWFSRRAIFAEAGGKLLTEPAKWLRLARKLQPRMGVANDGQAPRAVLVCFDAETFTRAGGQEAAVSAARTLRARLGEMSQAFGINLPVYVLFTRMDRVPFFTEYVRNLSKDEAGQVVGATIGMRDVRAGGVYGEEQTAILTAEFERLFRSLADARPEFLSREGDASKQPGAYEFPREFRKIRPTMVQFLVDVCQPSQLTVGPFLRGFYFTGVRPIVINETAPATPAPQAQSYDVGSTATGLFKAGMAPGAAQPAPVGATRKVPQWLFLTHLFNDVLLADSAAMGASGSSVKAGSMRRLLYMAAAVLCLLLFIAFTVSFFRNRGLETEARDAAVGISSAESSGQNLASLDALRKLETLRQSLATLVKYRHEGAPWSYKWGLYTGDSMYPEVRRIYFNRFRQLLFLQTQGAILENLRGLPVSQGPPYQDTYDALKAYLITTSHHDKSTVAFLSPVLTKWWALNRGPDADRMTLAQKQFDFYAAELKEENPFSGENDGQAVEHSRAYLKQFAGAERVYAFMLGEAGKNNPPVDYNRQFPGASQAVSQPHVVPGAFSKGGWTFMKDAIAHADKYFNGEQWVLGESGAANLDRAAMAAAIKERYYSDFVKQWRTYLKSASVVRYASLKDATAKLALLSGNQSPLLELFALASTHTAVDDANVAKIFQSAQTVVPPGSTDRFILPPNQNYMNALVAIQTSLEAIANSPGAPNEGAAQMTVNNATQGKVTVKQLAQAFTIDAEGHVENNVQKLLEDPITYLEPMLRSIDVPELNAGGKSLCGSFRPVLNKYPFNPAATSEVTLGELNALFRKPDGMLWAFFEQKLQKVLVRQGSQFVTSPTSKVTVNPAFLSFFNAAAGFGELLYSEGGQDPRFSYSLKPEPSEGVQMMTIRIDGQSLSYTAGTPAAFRKFTWQGSGAHEAMLSVRFGNTDLGFARGDGLWAAFHLFQQANQSTQQASGQLLEWVTSSGKGSQPVMLPSGRPLTVRFDLDLGAMPPIFQRGYLSRMSCIQEIAR
ncbi:MAG: ImcF-related family protein [Candidatus Solibacter sp.]